MPTTARSSKDWNSFSPYLWSVFLELATLLDKFFPRLLTFILSVSQYCCCGIEFSLSRKTTKKGTTVRVLIITKIKIKACMSITSSGISRRLGCTEVQNKAPSFQKRDSCVSIERRSATFFIPPCNQNTIFPEKHSCLYHNITHANSRGVQYTPPNASPKRVRMTNLEHVQAGFIFTCLQILHFAFVSFSVKKVMTNVATG